MHSSELKEMVREAYAGIEAKTTLVAETLYSPDELAAVPESAVDRALGVGNHLRHAGIEPGEFILDIGCGAGIDSVIAARQTGPSGQVIALDFLPEMLDRTAKAAAQAGLSNVKPVLGEMEAIPVPDDSVDHIICNGVLNLSPRKMRVLSECARVLRPEGRLSVSDLTMDETELPSEIQTHPAAWAG
jgi:arsenite methyltransferase